MRGCLKKLAVLAAILAATLMVVVIAIWAYRYRGERLSDQAWDAYYEGRPTEALSLYHTITQQYPSWSIFEDVAQFSHHRAVELEDFLRADSLQDAGQVDEAIAAYASFLEEHYPAYFDGDFSTALYLSRAREALADLMLTQAQTLRENGHFARSIEAHRPILELRSHGGEYCAPQDHWDTWGAACQQADETIEDAQARARVAIPELFAEWDQVLAQQGDYEGYILNYQAVLREYPAMMAHARNQSTLDRAYGEWAVHMLGVQGYEAAIEKYRSAMEGYPDSLDTGELESILARMYCEWATELRESGDYEGAIHKYEIVLEEYPDMPSGLGADALAAETYIDWADQLRETEQYAEAIEKYQVILREYPHTPAALEAEAAMAETTEELDAWRAANPAVPVADFPEEVGRDSDGRWSWTIVFGEKGGIVGYSLSGEGWIVDAQGARYGSWGTIIDRGSLAVPPGGWAEDSYWVRGDDFVGGYAVFTWSGEDDNGHPIVFEEKVHLLP